MTATAATECVCIHVPPISVSGSAAISDCRAANTRRHAVTHSKKSRNAREAAGGEQFLDGLRGRAVNVAGEVLIENFLPSRLCVRDASRCGDVVQARLRTPAARKIELSIAESSFCCLCPATVPPD